MLNPIAMPDTSYDGSGYINSFVEMPDMTNPYEGMVQASQGQVNTANNAASNIPQYQQQLQNKANDMNKYGQSTMPMQVNYPALPNEYGLGNTSGSQAPQDQTSHGFNPWSLRGEALSR